jgi:hypothetical protein
MYVQREFLSVAAVATAVAAPAVAQTLSGAGTTTTETHGPVSSPNFSRAWTHPGFPWFEPPASGPGPVTNKSRWPQRPIGASGTLALPPLPPGVAGVSDYDQLVGDYSNPILQPWAAEVVKKYGEMSLAGITFPNPSNQCWPSPMPFIYKLGTIQMMQQPDRITILYGGYNNEVRHVRLNEPLSPIASMP